MQLLSSNQGLDLHNFEKNRAILSLNVWKLKMLFAMILEFKHISSNMLYQKRT